MIEFVWQDKGYTLPYSAAGAESILLPDYTVLLVDRWQKEPITPILKRSMDAFQVFRIEPVPGQPRLTLETVARIIKGVIATVKN